MGQTDYDTVDVTEGYYVNGVLVIDSNGDFVGGIVAESDSIGSGELEAAVMKYIDVTLTSAQLLALSASPISVLATPGAGFANIVLGAVAYHAAGTAYAAIDVADDIQLQYTNGSGEDLLHIETTGFLDQATAQVRYYHPSQLATNVAAGLFALTPVANAAIVAHLNNGEITTGNFDLKLRIYYRTIPTVL